MDYDCKQREQVKPYLQGMAYSYSDNRIDFQGPNEPSGEIVLLKRSILLVNSYRTYLVPFVGYAKRDPTIKEVLKWVAEANENYLARKTGNTPALVWDIDELTDKIEAYRILYGNSADDDDDEFSEDDAFNDRIEEALELANDLNKYEEAYELEELLPSLTFHRRPPMSIYYAKAICEDALRLMPPEA